MLTRDEKAALGRRRVVAFTAVFAGGAGGFMGGLLAAVFNVWGPMLTPAALAALFGLARYCRAREPAYLLESKPLVGGMAGLVSGAAAAYSVLPYFLNSNSLRANLAIAPFLLPLLTALGALCGATLGAWYSAVMVRSWALRSLSVYWEASRPAAQQRWWSAFLTAVSLGGLLGWVLEYVALAGYPWPQLLGVDAASLTAALILVAGSPVGPVIGACGGLLLLALYELRRKVKRVYVAAVALGALEGVVATSALVLLLRLAVPGAPLPYGRVLAGILLAPVGMMVGALLGMAAAQPRAGSPPRRRERRRR